MSLRDSTAYATEHILLNLYTILRLFTLISVVGVDRILMAAPGRGRGRGRGPQSPVMGDLGDGQQDFLAAITNMANTIQEGIAATNAAHAAAAAAAGGSGGPAEDSPMTLASFLKINPPTFQGTANLTDADD
ncbi:hypothetical protein PIB30_064243 [Stylosanthes scabra]|uniref:Uncharacterized protein n=1 Tax=Stylosanthes scabra TaxID=79078 RepID=A0ABU6UQE8_9FABA|nr:hypothetical protein [Stylosanthes scabra]